ncbi:hypothetical protein T440DRAFT_401750 [Plenodomus tracheiphilus IPT5]|uniref:Uncharacterized protein n=1 Tax=Plenodomus tracheiphilus IPT5 TaxID=1408161 RepID=A0A6A7AYC3_9PLEO|nr:hypothetical protein T440DRAFT_401750 [Plenodomus tracheiphilus IPT5]
MSYLKKFMKNVNLHDTKTVRLLMATLIQHRGYWRSIDVIEPQLLNNAVDIAEVALKGHKVLSKVQVARAHKVVIISMPHKSDADGNDHYTLMVEDDKGIEFASAHITTDPSEQGVSQIHNKIYTFY